MSNFFARTFIMHGFSQAAVHVKDFVLDKLFPPNFFKSVYIVNQTFRETIKNNRLIPEKPAIAFNFEPKPGDAFFDNPYQLSGFGYSGHGILRLGVLEDWMNLLLSDEIKDIYVWEVGKRFRFNLPISVRIENQLMSHDIRHFLESAMIMERNYRLTDRQFYVIIPPEVINRIALKAGIDNTTDLQLWLDDVSHHPIEILRNPADGTRYVMFKIIQDFFIMREEVDFSEVRSKKIYKHTDMKFSIRCDFSFPALFGMETDDIVDEVPIVQQSQNETSVMFVIPKKGQIPGYLENGMRLIATSKFEVDIMKSTVLDPAFSEELLKGQITFNLEELNASNIQLDFREQKEKLYGEIAERRFVTIPGTDFQIPIGWRIEEDDLTRYEESGTIRMFKDESIELDGWPAFSIESMNKDSVVLETTRFFDELRSGELYSLTCTIMSDQQHNSVELELNGHKTIFLITQENKFQTASMFVMNGLPGKDILRLRANFSYPGKITIANVSVKEYSKPKNPYPTMSDKSLYFKKMLSVEQNQALDELLRTKENPFTAFYFLIATDQRAVRANEYEVDWEQRLITLNIADGEVNQDFYLGVYGDFDRIKRLIRGMDNRKYSKSGKLKTYD